MNPKSAELLRDKIAVALSASQDWAPGFRQDKKQFKILLESEVRLQRKLKAYFKDLADERILRWVDWIAYAKEVVPVQAAKPNFKVLVTMTDDDVSEEVGIVTKIVYKEMATIATAAANATVSEYRIPVDNLSVLVDKVARERAADLATQLTETTIEKVRASIETSLKLGETRDEATTRLSAFIDDTSKAETVARTESANAWRRGVLETGAQTGAVSKTWHVEGDPCDICLPLDGLTVDIDDEFPGGLTGEDGAHPNCRCDVSLNYKVADDA